MQYSNRHIIFTIRIFTALTIAGLILGSALSGCRKIDEDVSPSEDKTHVFTIRINADKENKPMGKGLTLDGEEATATKLNSIWREGDTVHAYRGSNYIGYLLATPDANEPSRATLSGNIVTDNIVVNSTMLTLITPHKNLNYTGQNGQLLSLDNAENSIEANYHFSMASVRVTSISEGVVTTQPAKFANRQSIYRMSFRYVNSSGKTPINVKSVTVESASNKIIRSNNGSSTSVYGSISATLPSATTAPFFVALSNDRETVAEDYTFTVIDSEGITYYGSKRIPKEYKPNGTFVSMKNTSLTGRLSFTVNDTEVTTAI